MITIARALFLWLGRIGPCCMNITCSAEIGHCMQKYVLNCKLSCCFQCSSLWHFLLVHNQRSNQTTRGTRQLGVRMQYQNSFVATVGLKPYKLISNNIFSHRQQYCYEFVCEGFKPTAATKVFCYCGNNMYIYILYITDNMNKNTSCTWAKNTEHYTLKPKLP